MIIILFLVTFFIYEYNGIWCSIYNTTLLGARWVRCLEDIT